MISLSYSLDISDMEIVDNSIDEEGGPLTLAGKQLLSYTAGGKSLRSWE